MYVPDHTVCRNRKDVALPKLIIKRKNLVGLSRVVLRSKVSTVHKAYIPLVLLRYYINYTTIHRILLPNWKRKLPK